MAETKKQLAHTQALSMLRVQGIIATVFGGLGIFFGLILMVIFAFAIGNAYSDNELIEYTAWFIVSIIFILIPHIYLVVSGVILMRQPEPKTARLFTIINLIVGAMSNFVILAFAIISLTQTTAYEEGYKLNAK